MRHIYDFSRSVAMGILISVIGTWLLRGLTRIGVIQLMLNALSTHLHYQATVITSYMLIEFIPFGLLGIGCGWVIGRYGHGNWHLHGLICYLSHFFYVRVILEWLAGIRLDLPTRAYIDETFGLPLMVIPLCILLSAYLFQHHFIRHPPFY